MKYQIGEVVRFVANGKLATITAVADGVPDVYQTATTFDCWFHESEFEPVNGGMPKHRSNFLSDEEKMYDFLRLSKDEFLASYSYLTEEEYEATTDAYRALSQVLQDWVDECKRIAWQSCHGADQPVSETGREIDHKESASESISLDDIFVAIRRLSDDDYDRFVKAMFRGMSLDKISAGVCTLCDEDFEAVYQELEMESQRRDEKQQRILAGAIVSAMDAYLQKFGDDHDFCCSGYGDIITLSMMHDAIVNEFDLSAS